MGLLADVTPNTPILSAWGNTVRNQSVMPFTNAAERASQWTAPPEGALSYLRDTDTLSYYTGSAWRGIAYGEQGFVQNTTTTGYFVAAMSAIPVVGTITNVGPGGRIYRVEFECLLEVVGVTGSVAIYQDGAQITQRNYAASSGAHVTARTAPAAGSHSWTIFGQTSVAGSNVRIVAAATYPSLFTLTDLGPVTP